MLVRCVKGMFREFGNDMEEVTIAGGVPTISNLMERVGVSRGCVSVEVTSVWLPQLLKQEKKIYSIVYVDSAKTE